MAERVLTFKQWCWDEGYEDHVEGDDLKEAESAYKEYLESQNLKVKIEKTETTIIGKEEKMPRYRGNCYNCERPDMKLNAPNHGLCGSCQLAVTGTKAGTPEREAKLKEARAKYFGKGKLGHGPRAVTGVKNTPVSSKAKTRAEDPPPALKAKDEANDQATMVLLPLKMNIAIKIPFTNRFVDVLRLSIGGVGVPYDECIRQK